VEKKKPHSFTAAKNRLKHDMTANAEEILLAMQEASDAIDQKVQECAALRRIIIAERAQVIYYTEKYRSFAARECVEPFAIGFLDLSEAQQEKYVKLAIQELNVQEGTIPHEAEEAKAPEAGKRVTLQ
jgi:hypothetical protein